MYILNFVTQFSYIFLLQFGTEKLMFIGKGLVIFDKVPSLCFVNTVDWKRIGASGTLIYDQNRDCEPCPRQCGGEYTIKLSPIIVIKMMSHNLK